jgi:hypothetical protein
LQRSECDATLAVQTVTKDRHRIGCDESPRKKHRMSRKPSRISITSDLFLLLSRTFVTPLAVSDLRHNLLRLVLRHI